MNEFSKLRKSVKRKAVELGAIKHVATLTGRNKGTVSRTLAGKIDTPHPVVVSALREFIESMHERGSESRLN